MNITNYTGPKVLTYTPTNVISSESTKELILKYCSAIDQKLIIVIGIAALMWILQPAVFKAIDKIEYENRFVKEVF